MSNPNRVRHRPSLFWPFLLIGVGVILLLSNLDILPPNAFNIMWRFWPLLLVVIGLDLLLGRRSALGSIISLLLVLGMLAGVLAVVIFANNLPIFHNLESAQLRHETISAPLEDIESAAIRIDWTSGPAFLYPLSDSNNLLEGELNYYGDLIFDVQPNGGHVEINLDSRTSGFLLPRPEIEDQDRSWRIGLHPDIVLDLNLDAGSGRGDYDLSKLNIHDFVLDAGSGAITISLPEQGHLNGTIDGGSGALLLLLPEQMEAQIMLDAGSGSFVPSSRFTRLNREDDDQDIWQTENFDRAANSLSLQIDQGSGAITIE